MKISSNNQAKVEAGKKKLEKAPEKKNLSDSEIKAKLEEHVRVSLTPKKVATEQSQKLGEGFMNQDVKPFVAKKEELGDNEEVSDKKDHLIKSDIAKNDPRDTNTQEKLKSALAMGAFNFSAKEREALERILK